MASIVHELDYERVQNKGVWFEKYCELAINSHIISYLCITYMLSEVNFFYKQLCEKGIVYAVFFPKKCETKTFKY